MAEPPCPPELWPQFSSLLDTALDLPEAERSAWLAGLGPEHDQVRPWLAKVLAETMGVETSDFLERPVVRPEILSEFAAGQRIGPYVLERELGRGGMGEVWLAARADGTLSRRVALKLPYAYLMAGVLRRRFERERDILATLSHPHIAQLYDAGVSPGGHPYLAMEWVEGVPINRYCREARLALPERFALFQQVLEAVDHAHSRLIAHRDIKPSNILVTRDGQVKLLDFGIAKLLGGDTGGESTELTRVGGRAITPEYAAPEQIAGAPLTTAVDLYALGVVLYELLTGKRPFEALPQRGPAMPMDAPKASSRVSAEHAQSIGGMDLRSLRRALNGDIDAILAKALEATPARRYRTAQAFSEDIERHLRHQPISARHIGLVAQGFKFVRRHRLGVAFSAGLLLLLIAGSAGIAWQAVRAEREAQRATAIKDFLISMFRASDPRIASDKPRGTITARDLLDMGSGRIEKDFANDPDTEIELLGVTANIYAVLNERERNLALLHRQRELARKRYGELHPIVISALLDEVDDAITNGNREEALKLLDEVDRRISQGGLERSTIRARSWLQRGQVLISDYASRSARAKMLDGAVSLYAEIAPTDPGYPTALGERANLYLAEDDYAHAIAHYLQAVAVDEKVNPRNDGELVSIYQGLAMSYRGQGDFESATRTHEFAVNLAQKTYGFDSYYYWDEAAEYAELVHSQGNRGKALEMFENLLRHLPAESARYESAVIENSVALVKEKYGYCLAMEGRFEEAIPFLESAEQNYISAPQYDDDLPRLRITLGNAYDRVGRANDANRVLQQSLKEYLRRGQTDDVRVLAAFERWGSFLSGRGYYGKAESQFNEVLSRAQGKKPQIVAITLGDMAQQALKQGETQKGLKLSTQAIDADQATSGPHDVRTLPNLMRIKAEALLLAGQIDEARILAMQALDALRRYDGPNSLDIARTEATLSKIKEAKAHKQLQSLPLKP
jgi:serine/threonine-protein kinase